MTAALGIALGLAAAALYAVGVSLQAADARRVPPEHALRPSLLARLARRRYWLAGSALGLLGWPFQIAALVVAPLALVQSTVAAGLLLVLALLARAQGHPPRRRESLAMVALAAGIAGLGWAVPARSGEADPAALAAVFAVLAAVALAPYLWRPLGRSPILAAAGSGFAYAWSSVATKLVADAFGARSWLSLLLWLAAAGLAATVALISEMTALQRRPPYAVVPVVFAIDLVAPLAAAIVAFEERWRGRAGAIVVAVAASALLVAMITLARPASVPSARLS